MAFGKENEMILLIIACAVLMTVFCIVGYALVRAADDVEEFVDDDEEL